MKLHSISSELLAVKVLCSNNKVLSGTALSMLDADYFYTDEGQEGYAKVLSHMQEIGQPPTYTLLCEDPDLSEGTRKVLRLSKKAVKSKQQLTDLVDLLGAYKQTRDLYRLSSKIVEHLDKPNVNVKGLVEAVQGKVATMGLRHSLEQSTFSVGTDSDVDEMVKEILFGEDNNNVIPTGLKTFDQKNGGFLRGSLILIAGGTGSGKCLSGEALVTMAGGTLMDMKAIWERGTNHKSTDGVGQERDINLSVATRSGARPVVKVYKCYGYPRRVKFDNGAVLRMLANHKLLRQIGPTTEGNIHYDWVRAVGMIVGDTFATGSGLSLPAKIVSIEQEICLEPMYDIEVQDVHEYYANGIVSHNSLVSGQLSMNQALMGYKVGFVPLEMGVSEVLGRQLANVSSYENTEIQFKRLATGEKKKAWKKWKAFSDKIAAKGGKLTYLKPQVDISAAEVFASFRAMPNDILYIDYVSLLSDASGDEQWKRLGEIARQGKLYAEHTNKAVVLLAQVSDDGLIKYSRTMGEHASTTFVFTASKESRDQGYLRINMGKARNQVMLDFTVGIDYATQRLFDLEAHDETSDTTEAPGKSDDDAKYVPDLTGD